MTDLSGRRILVTGASSGIGEATVRELAAAGARVASMARRADRIEKLAAEVGGVAVVGDLRDEASIRSAVETAANELGGLDGLVNNAGVAHMAPIRSGSIEQWREMLDTNVLGLLIATQAALPLLEREPCADIVNVSSMSGRRVAEKTAGVYAGSKAAVNLITSGLRKEVYGTAIRVSLVYPGLIATEMIERQAASDAPSEMAKLGQALAIPPAALARAIAHVIGEPPDVNVLDIAVMPTAQELGWS